MTSKNDSLNDGVEKLPRGRVCVTGLSGRPFDHVDAVGSVAVVVSANGQVHMHCSIRGAVLLDLLEIVKERYYSAPMRANMPGEMARKAATGIVTAHEVPQSVADVLGG